MTGRKARSMVIKISAGVGPGATPPAPAHHCPPAYLRPPMHQNARLAYTRAFIPCTDPSLREVLTALLSDTGYEAFEETGDGLAAYIPEGEYDAEATAAMLQRMGNDLKAEVTTIQHQNWNAQWEQSFEPVTVPGVCVVRAHFHAPQPGAHHDIVITPRMAFGTGHHATTYLMMQAMAGLDFRGKQVLDFGCGTGVLAILAGKMGAAGLSALEIDPGAAEQAREHADGNGCPNADVRTGGLEVLTPGISFDIILANINLHVLLADMAGMSGLLLPGGSLLLSGVRVEDEPVLLQAATEHALRHISTNERNGWLALLFSRSAQA